MKTQITAATAALAAVVALFTVWINWRAKALEDDLGKRGQRITETGKPAPSFSLPALDGHAVSLADYRGKKNVVLAFWASWCSPCRGEMAALARLYEHGGFEILAISVDEDRAAAERFAKDVKVPFPVLLDPGMTTIDKFHVESLPSLVAVESDGKIIFGRAGFDQRVEFELGSKLGITDIRRFRGGMNVVRGN
jgi:peroxiredoxin